MTSEHLSGPDAARTRFIRRQALLMMLFAVSVVAGDLLTRATDHVGARIAATVLPTAILILWGSVFARMIRGEDEMMHLLQLRAVAIGAGLVLFLASLWGLYEQMLGAPRLPGFLLLPAFAVAYSIVLFMQGVRQR
jgi:hypothetical protein